MEISTIKQYIEDIKKDIAMFEEKAGNAPVEDKLWCYQPKIEELQAQLERYEKRLAEAREVKKAPKNYYAESYTAGDAFIAGHFGEYVEGNKKYFTKSQLAHAIKILNDAFMELAGEGKFNPDQLAKHFNLVYSDIEDKKKGDK